MKKLVLALFLFLAAAPAWATTYYVRTGGLDAHSCVSATTNDDAHAKQTVVAGINCMSSGDTVIIGDGIYVEAIRPHINVTLPNGTVGNPTIIKAANARQVTLRPASGFYTVSLAGNFDYSYITFDGIIADGINSLSEPWNLDTDLPNTISHIVVNNCVGINAQDDGSHAGLYGIGFGKHLTNSTLTNSEFYNNPHYGVYVSGANNLIDGNYIHDNGGFGLHVYNSGGGANNNIIRNNRIYHNSTGSDPSSTGDNVLFGAGDGNQFYNNLVYGGNGPSGPTNGINLYSGTTNGLFYNNTIVGNSGYCLTTTDSSVSGNNFKNNICYQNTLGAISDAGTATVCANNLNVTLCGATAGSNDPKFVSSGTGDFRLQAGSPAIGAGLDLSATFTTDFSGLTRTVPWDEGAYKVGATYYVNKSGNNGNSCATAQSATPANAKLTISAGVACMTGGDTVIIGDGNYDEQDLNPLGGASAGAPSIIQAANRNQAHIQIANGHYAFLPTHSYVTIDGMYLDCDVHFINQCGGIYISTSVTPNLNGINFQHGTINKAGNATGDPGSEASGFEGNYSTSLILDNDFISIGRGDAFSHGVYIGNNNSSDNNIVDGNRFTNNSCFSIHIFHPNSNNIIRNNVISGDGCTGILVAWGPGTQVYNNLVINGINGGTGEGVGTGIEVCSAPVTSAFIYNNTIVGNNGPAVLVDSSCTGNYPSGVIIENNIIYRNTGGAISDSMSVATCSNNLNATVCGLTQGLTDPLFVNAVGGNYHLQAGSPAIGFGLDLSATFTKDFDGATRVVPWTMGVFIFSPTLCANSDIGHGWRCIASTSAISSDNTNVTTPAINTIGADLIVFVEAVDQSFTTPTMTDSMGNTWHGLTIQTDTHGKFRLQYCSPCIVGSSQTFSVAQASSYPALCGAAFSGSKSSPFDVQNGSSTGNAMSLATGSITPSQANTLIIAGLGLDDATGGITVNSSFTITTTLNGSANAFGCSISYLTQGTAGAINPTWNFGGVSQEATAGIADFEHLAASNIKIRGFFLLH